MGKHLQESTFIAKVGDLNSLQTVDKTNIVNAINEMKANSGKTKVNSYTWSAVANQTVFTIGTGSYIPNSGNMEVHVGGKLLISGTDYTETSPTSFTLLTITDLEAGDTVYAKWFENVNLSAGATVVEDNLTSSSNSNALSANQGKALNNKIGILTNLNTTAKTDLVSAVNEVNNKNQTKVNQQYWTASVGQTVFNITSPGNYIINKGNIQVFIGGIALVSGKDYTETSSTSFTLTNSDLDGEVVFAKWFEQVSVVASSTVIEDVLTSTNNLNALSANQGRVLDGKIAANTTTLSSKANQTSVDQLGINAKDKGAKGDGTVYDSSAIQSAIDSANSQGIKTVKIPSGTYKMLNKITLYEGMSLEGVGEVIFDLDNKAWSRVIEIVGTVNAETPLLQNAGIGTTSLSIDPSYVVNKGDYVIVKSQRSALGVDASPYFRLGVATGTTDSCYFGEFKYLQDASSGTLTVSSGLIFPNYQIDKTLETASTARNSSTVQKVNFIKKVTVDNIRFQNGSVNVNSTSAVIYVEYGKDVQIKNCRFESTLDGNFIRFNHCLDSKAILCRAKYTSLAWVAGGNHYYQNAFISASSTGCGFEECTSENGSQPYDITYLNGGLPSIGCFVNMCKSFYSNYNCATTHPGTYMCDISYNKFLHCRDSGISLRGRSSSAVGNMIQGEFSQDKGNAYAVAIAEGWARNCIVSKNQITGFPVAIVLSESYSVPRDITFKDGVDLIIEGNSVSLFNCFLRLILDVNRPTKTLNANIRVANNVMSNFLTYGSTNPYVMYVEGDSTITVTNIDVDGNTVDANSYTGLTTDIPKYFIRCKSNGDDYRFRGNTVKNMRNDGSFIFGGTTFTVGIEYDMTNNIKKLDGTLLPLIAASTNVNLNKSRQGTTRPTTSLYVGREFLDLTLNKKIWYDGTQWRDTAGTVV